MSDHNVYTAERILAKRKHHGVTQYYIKWKGYSIKESTWEPIENILDRSLLVTFENSSSKNKASSSSHHSSSAAGTSSSNRNSSTRSNRSSRLRNESRSSSTSSTSSSRARSRGRPRKKSYVEQRQEQVRLQRHIELQQQHKTHLVHQSVTNNDDCSGNSNQLNDNKIPDPDRKQLVVFNPIGNRSDIEVEEVVYEPELPKNPVLVTDVTADDLTVTISECRTPEGFFRT